MRKITINDTEYALRYSLRGLFVFEKITGRIYGGNDEGSALFDMYIFFYALLLSGNEHFALSVEDFIGACDDDPRLMAAFNEVILEHNARNEAILAGTEEDSKKKVRRSS